MLSIERIFRLYHTCMIYKSFLLRSFNKSIGHIQICHCRIFNWRIFSACSFHTYCCCRNYNVSTFYFRLHSTTGSDSDKSIRSAAIQLFHCNGRWWATNTGWRYTDLHSIQCSCISDIFPVVCDQHRIIKILCNLYTSFRISRKDHITAHFTFCHLNMILSVYIFWVIFHNHPILFVFTWNIGCHCLTILLINAFKTVQQDFMFWWAESIYIIYKNYYSIFLLLWL